MALADLKVVTLPLAASFLSRFQAILLNLWAIPAFCGQKLPRFRVGAHVQPLGWRETTQTRRETTKSTIRSGADCRETINSLIRCQNSRGLTRSSGNRCQICCFEAD